MTAQLQVKADGEVQTEVMQQLTAFVVLALHVDDSLMNGFCVSCHLGFRSTLLALAC